MFDFFVDGDEGFAFHLAVGVVQVGRGVAVADDAVESDPAGVADAQPAAHEDDGEQAALGVVPAIEVGRLLDLGHDVLGQPARQALVGFGEVVGIERRIRRQARIPFVAADRVQERAERTDVAAAGVQRAGVGGQVGQIALQHRSGDSGETGHLDRRGGEKPGEPGDRSNVDIGLVVAAADAQPPAGEPFRQLAQPGLRDAVEPQPPVAFDAYPSQFPDISWEFGLPAGPEVQVFDAAVGVAQKRQLTVLAVLGGMPSVEELRPQLDRPVQQGHRVAGGDQRNDGPCDGGGGLDLPLVVSALQARTASPA